MNSVKAIIVEWRKPQSKFEKKCWGVTQDQGDLSKVFIRSSANGTPMATEVFFHEMAHVYFNFHKGRKLKRGEEERLAEKIGKAARGLIC